MIVIISLFAKNNNSFSNPAARKKRIFPRQAPTLLANAQRESSTLWYAARRLNEGMDADTAAALNALWEKLV